jgi:hypothetical protein
MPYTEGSDAKVYQPSTDKRPSGKQWWKIAQEAIRLLGVDAPTNRAEASDLIDRLSRAGTPAASQDMPF